MDHSIVPFQITTGVWMVPCSIDRSLKRYRPVTRPFSALKDEDKIDTRKSWTREEDEILKEIIKDVEPKHWSAIAIELNEQAHSGLPLRKGKQCRERWLGHLNPNIIKKVWSEKEDAVLLIKQAALGNKWSEITEFLPGRTENQIKNRWRKLEKLGKTQPLENGQKDITEIPLELLIKQPKNQDVSQALEILFSAKYLMNLNQEP